MPSATVSHVSVELAVDTAATRNAGAWRRRHEVLAQHHPAAAVPTGRDE